MPRQNIYYLDVADTATSIRWRVLITPAYNAALPASAVPNFGSGAAVGIYIPLAGNIFFPPPDNEETGSEERPVGPLKLPSMKLTLNIANMTGGPDSDSVAPTDVEDLGYYFESQKWDNAATIEGRSISTSLCFEILTDRGDSSLLVSEFLPYFVGVQRVRPTMTWVINYRNRALKVDLELVHLVRIALEEIIADDVATRLQNSPPTLPRTNVTTTYEILGQDAAHSITIGHVREGPDSNPQQADFYRLVDLYYTIATCVEDVIAAYRRRSGAQFTFYSNRPTTVSGRGVGTPVDVFLLHEQVLDESTGRKGPAISPGDLYFPGRVSYVATGQFIGGFLRDDSTGDKQESLFRWGNIWSYLEAACGAAKMRLETTPEGNYLIHWDTVRPSGTRITIGPRHFFDTDEIEMVQGEGTIRKTTAEPQEDAHDGVSYEFRGLEGEPEQNVSLVHTNQPDPGEDNQAFFWRRSSTRFGTPETFLVGQPGFRPFALYYFTTPGGTVTSSEICVRPHHYTALDTGAGWRVGDCTEYIALPILPGITLGGSYDLNSFKFYETYVWVPIRGIYAQMIAEACLPFAAAKGLTHTLGNPKQLRITGKFRMTDLWWQDVGRRVAATEWASPNDFLWEGGPPFMTNLPGEPVIVTAKDSPATGTCDAEFLAIPN